MSDYWEASSAASHNTWSIVTVAARSVYLSGLEKTSVFKEFIKKNLKVLKKSFKGLDLVVVLASFVLMLALLSFCVATVFSVNKIYIQKCF